MEMLTFATIFLHAQIWILENDNGKWNHMLHRVDIDDKRHLLISYTGDEPLGQEGEYVSTVFTNLKCDQVLAKSSRSVGDRAYPGGAYICTAEGVQK